MIRKITFFFLIWIFFNPSKVLASHYRGGEITWECLTNGQFKFRAVFYRDCNGIAAPNSISLGTTVPGIPTISMTQVTQTDVSHTGFQSNGVTVCASCSTPLASSGVVQKNVYESAPVTLTGVPPFAGYTFYWGECCRNNFLDNITGAGSIGFRMRAVMYPYQNQNLSTCYDSSPVFVEKPKVSFCSGVPQEYSYLVKDAEGDSIDYSWGPPLNDAGATVQFGPGYSINSQLPSTTQNPNNVAAVLNSTNGNLTYWGFTGGLFNTVVKATAYKCGVKVSETFREMDVAIDNSCAPVSGQANMPPTTSAPFMNPVTGLMTDYTKSVSVGDTVNFQMSFNDFQFFNNGTTQLIKVEAAGGIFGSNFLNPYQDCALVPCATFSYQLPHTVAIAGSLQFNWVISANHLAGLNPNCVDIPAVYRFNITLSDNYCPANATVTKTLTILVYPSPIFEPPVLRCASVNPDGSVSLNWSPTTTIDSLSQFEGYAVMASELPNGPFYQVDFLTAGISTSSFLHSASSLNSWFGANAQQQPIYYKIIAHPFAWAGLPSAPSNSVSTIKMNASAGTVSEAVLNWNQTSISPPGSQASNYYIYKEFPVGSWTLIDSTSSTSFPDFSTQVLCNDSVAYRVVVTDTTGCMNRSSDAGIVINDPITLSTILPPNPETCAGNSITLIAHNGQSYLWSTLETTQSISVNTPGTYSVTVTQAGGCTTQGSTVVTIGQPPTPVITGTTNLCFGQNGVLNAGNGYSSYLWSTGATTQTINLSQGVGNTTYTVTVTHPNGCTGTDSQIVTVNPLPVVSITGITAFCQGYNTTLSATPGFSSYLWNVGTNTQNLVVNTSGTYTVTVTNANGCTASASKTVTANPIPNPIITGNLTFCPGDSTILQTYAGYQVYQWSGAGTGVTPSITAWVAGTYIITVSDANGCSGSTSVLVTQLTGPILNLPSSTSFCQGGSVVLSPGSANFYLWSTGETTQSIQVNNAGTYTVTLTNSNGCSVIASTVVTENPNPTPILNGTTFCQGSFGNLDAGQGWTMYQWSNGATSQTIQVTTGGIYSVTVTDIFGCSGSDSALVTVYTQPPAVATAMGNTSFCVGDSVLLNATAGYPGYLWYRHTNPIQPNITSQGMYVKAMGNYYCRVTDSNGCTNFSNAIFIEAPCVPIGDPGEKAVDETGSFFIAFPNPSNDNFILHSNNSFNTNEPMLVVDLTGREVRCNIIINNSNEIVISELPPGIFIFSHRNNKIRLIKME